MNYVSKYVYSFASIASIIAYIAIAYFFPRENFIALFGCYSVAFFSFIALCKNESITEKQLFYLGIFFRALFLFGIPFWSQDFYRFIWDGNLVSQGFNPYLNTPNQIINSTSIPNAQELYNKMGVLSAAHYSNYPPINQLLFGISSYLSPNSIFCNALILKLIILVSDIGIYHFGRKILLHLHQNPKKIFLYFLNPLVIIELTANLHFEGVMLFLFTLGIYYFFKEKIIVAALFLALSISTKLLTLLLLPFFFHQLGLKKSSYFYSVILSVVLLTFLPFYSSVLVSNYSKTIGLWFTNFEFNASIYYIIREIGFYVKGYNIIQTIGKFTPFVTLLVFLYFAVFKKNKPSKHLFSNALFALSIYFFISTTVHPWYIINVVFLSLFTRFKFPVFWSYLVILSYFAYSNTPFKENYILLLIEYGLVFTILFYELIVPKNIISNG